MNVEEDLKKLIHQLVHKDYGTISVNGSDIGVRVFEHDSTLSLVTVVYNGGNYIPKSVRNCLKEEVIFPEQSIKTYLTLDEENFKVSLNYLSKMENMDRVKFKELLEEFSWLAEEWRNYLDEHDKHDLVHVRVL